MLKHAIALAALLAANASAYNFTNLKIKDIEASAALEEKSFYIIHFENEPDFENGGSGTQGVGFYASNSMAKTWLSIFELAHASSAPVDLLVDTEQGVDHFVNPFKWHCSSCGTASLLKAVKIKY